MNLFDMVIAKAGSKSSNGGLEPDFIITGDEEYNFQFTKGDFNTIAGIAGVQPFSGFVIMGSTTFAIVAISSANLNNTAYNLYSTMAVGLTIQVKQDGTITAVA